MVTVDVIMYIIKWIRICTIPNIDLLDAIVQYDETLNEIWMLIHCIFIYCPYSFIDGYLSWQFEIILPLTLQMNAMRLCVSFGCNDH